MKRPLFINSHIYHIYNRGVEKRNVFMDEEDHFRFIHDLFEFNDVEFAPRFNPRLRAQFQSPFPLSGVRLPKVERKPRKLLVEILAFCLMPNHYHLMVSQKRDKGISEFMHKLGTGYTNYFNEKYKRVGSLFQGKFKAVLIEEDPHFLYLPYYIHFNPLDLVMPEWRKGQISDFKKAIEFLDQYRWSSHLDYFGKKNYPSVTSREFLLRVFNGHNNYKDSVEKWLKELDLSQLDGVALDEE